MAAPTSTNEVTARKLSSSISALWTKIKSTFQPVADRVTSIRASSSATDTNYPSEKAVAAALESKAPSAVTSEVTIANGDKMIIADASDSSKLKRASAAFDGSTTKKFLNQKGTFTQVLEADLEWGGVFRTSKAPVENFALQNVFFGPKPSAISVEYSNNRTSDNPTWTDYGLTDAQKMSLLSGTSFASVYCGKKIHCHPGYTGNAEYKDLSNENIADQGLRITICCRSLTNRTTDTDSWVYCSLKRILMYMSTQSAGGGAHCVVEKQNGTQYKENSDTWTTLGDYKIQGDSGWNSIPYDGAFGGWWTQTSNYSWVIRFTIWSDTLSANPNSGQTGCLLIQRIVALSSKVFGSTGARPPMQVSGVPYTVDYNGKATFADIAFTARKLKTNLARTADSTFDGSADQLNIPVTGTLPVANGGTGKSSVTSGNYLVGNGTSAFTEKAPKTVGNNVLAALDEGSSAFSTDNAVIITGDAAASNTTTFYRRKFSYIWTWIQSKISTVLGLSTTGYTGNAATADTAKAYDTSFSGTNSIASALNGKSPTTHTHKTDAADVTSDDTNLGDAEDTMQFVTTDAAGYDSSRKPLYRRPALKIWNWIKSKLASDTGYINFKHSVDSATNVNSHVLAGVVFTDNSLHSCMFTFVMAVTFNFRESDECGGILKVDVGIGTSGFYVKNISLSNVTGALSVGDFKLVVGEVLNRKVVGVTWNGVLKGSRYLRGTILSRYVAGDDTEFMYNGDVANGATQAWSSARQWADDSAVVHIAGSETITGAKEFSRSGQDTNFTDSSGAESIIRARTATNSNNGSCQLDAYASGGKYGLYARNSGGAEKWVANLDNDGVVNLGSSGDAVRIGGTKFVFGASQLGTESNTFYWV